VNPDAAFTLQRVFQPFVEQSGPDALDPLAREDARRRKAHGRLPGQQAVILDVLGDEPDVLAPAANVELDYPAKTVRRPELQDGTRLDRAQDVARSFDHSSPSIASPIRGLTGQNG